MVASKELAIIFNIVENMGVRLAAMMAFVLVVVTGTSRALAWTEHEHVTIGRRALSTLAREHKHELLELEKAWERWGEGDADLVDDAGRPLLCKQLSADGRCIELVTLPMMAGDHSCTPDDLFVTMRRDWYFDVVEVVNEANDDLEDLIRSVPEDERKQLAPKRLNIRRILDVRLQTVDPDYISRASNNLGHFAVPLEAFDESLVEYVKRVLPGDAGVSIRQSPIGLYVHFHLRALYYAAIASQGEGKVYERRMAFLFEAYALHFLQDMYSAGHMFGAPQGDAVRIGTHDHFCEHGLNTKRWLKGDELYHAHGDAFMREDDLARASAGTVLSLRQLASAFAGEKALMEGADEARWALTAADLASATKLRPPLLTGIDTCHDVPLEPHHGPNGYAGLEKVLELSPRPQLGPEPWSEIDQVEFATVETHRAGYGVVFPFIVDVRGGPSFFTESSSVERAFMLTPEVHLGVGVGYSGEGVMSTNYDALVYVAPMAFLGGEYYPLDNSDRRFRYVGSYGVGFRLRLPFAYVPGDALLFGPLAAAGFTSGFEMAQRAFRGGLFGSYTVFFVGPVRFRIDLGREIDLMWRFRGSRDVKAMPVEQQTALYSGWDLTLPLLSTRIIKGLDARLGAESAFRLAFRMGSRVGSDDTDVRGFHVGGLLSIANIVSLYLD